MEGQPAGAPPGAPRPRVQPRDWPPFTFTEHEARYNELFNKGMAEIAKAAAAAAASGAAPALQPFSEWIAAHPQLRAHREELVAEGMEETKAFLGRQQQQQGSAAAAEGEQPLARVTLLVPAAAQGWS